MMGRMDTQKALFQEFSIEDHIPEDHLLQQIDRFIDLAPLRAELAPFHRAAIGGQTPT